MCSHWLQEKYKKVQKPFLSEDGDEEECVSDGSSTHHTGNTEKNYQ